MKRFIVLLIITAVCLAGFLSARDVLPLAPVLGPGMAPVLSFIGSQTGTTAVIIGLVVLAVLLFGSDIIRLGKLLLLAIFSPIIDEEKRINHSLSRQIEANEKKINATELALKDFSAAVAEYAQHLSSHTSAIKGLAEASHELKKGGAAQNHFLESIVKNTEERLVSKDALLATMKVKVASLEESAPEVEKPAPKKPRPTYRALHPSALPAPPPAVEKPAPEDKKTVFEKANLVEAMVLPYYRALNKLEADKPKPEPEKPLSKSEETTTEAKKAVEEIMFPLYKTLYHPEKTDESGVSTSRRKPSGSTPPGCARQRHPLKPW